MYSWQHFDPKPDSNVGRESHGVIFRDGVQPEPPSFTFNELSTAAPGGGNARGSPARLLK